MPMEESPCWRMDWEMVLNAVLRSRRRRIDRTLASAARSRSVVILIFAVSGIFHRVTAGSHCIQSDSGADTGAV